MLDSRCIMNQLDIFELARHVGATNEDGTKAETIFCFTRKELEEFAKRLITDVAHRVYQDKEHPNDV